MIDIIFDRIFLFIANKSTSDYHILITHGAIPHLEPESLQSRSLITSNYHKASYFIRRHIGTIFLTSLFIFTFVSYFLYKEIKQLRHKTKKKTK